eukprot:CAMPEP_0197824906 /NCGR_PEP_ID=MMETSP1437-20131217/2097_1 /TAXON_ID=49252 ORGANISM="Eucampia antarctica, Strain CCMP1452" /NCGR_SAMPLE_ID=MMETSP1437 /ASSEMBLY_ACC=CAM_ASM_001096 /LENGTH=329 /DNA_ID=CAMNT_0043424711 /DNA_START=208 /DNA_END=1195 /DNA_ORIENTATION=+
MKSHPQESKWASLIAEILVIGAMPFLYSTATRLPFIYFVIHLKNTFLLNWLTIGLCVASYHGTRIMTIAVSMKYPKFAHLMGTLGGLAGYTIVFVSDKDSVIPFVIGTVMVGLSETISSMQIFAKEMYKLDPDRKKAQKRLKYQYSFVMAGQVFAYLIGGVVMTTKKVEGVAVVGIILQSSGVFLFFFFFWCLQMKDEVNGRLDGTEIIDVSIKTIDDKNEVVKSTGVATDQGDSKNDSLINKADLGGKSQENDKIDFASITTSLYFNNEDVESTGVVVKQEDSKAVSLLNKANPDGKSQENQEVDSPPINIPENKNEDDDKPVRRIST